MSYNVGVVIAGPMHGKEIRALGFYFQCTDTLVSSWEAFAGLSG